MLPGVQIFAVASLFGVRAHKSSNADLFHEKFHLTELVAQPNAGILTRHGDLLVCLAAYVTASSSSVASVYNAFVRHIVQDATRCGVIPDRLSFTTPCCLTTAQLPYAFLTWDTYLCLVWVCISLGSHMHTMLGHHLSFLKQQQPNVTCYVTLLSLSDSLFNSCAQPLSADSVWLWLLSHSMHNSRLSTRNPA